MKTPAILLPILLLALLLGAPVAAAPKAPRHAPDPAAEERAAGAPAAPPPSRSASDEAYLAEPLSSGAPAGTSPGAGAPASPGAGSPAPSPIPDSATFVRLLFKMILATIASVGVILLLARFLARVRGLPPGGHLRVLDRVSLGAGKSVHLVQVHGKVLVVGTAGDSIAALSEFADPEERRAVLLEYKSAVTGESFVEQLRRFEGKPEPPDS